MFQKIEQIVDLRKKDVPLITIYGDSGDYEFTQFIWGLIPGFDVSVATPKTREELIQSAYNSALVFIMVGEGHGEGEDEEEEEEDEEEQSSTLESSSVNPSPQKPVVAKVVPHEAGPVE